VHLINRYPKVSLSILILIWGLGYPVMKFGMQFSPPLIYTGLRTIISGMFLMALAFYSGEPLNLRDTWKALLISTVFNVLLFFGASAFAVQLLPSGIASILLYAQPIMVGLLAHFLLHELLTLRKITGLLFGFLGVAIISYKGLTGDLSLQGVIMGLLSALGWTFGTLLVKRHNPRSIYWFIAIPFIGGGVLLFCMGLAVGEQPTAIVWNLPFISALLWGAIIGLGASWVIWFHLVRTVEASTLSANTFLVPVVSVIGGALFLGEKVPPSLYLGGALVVLGIYQVNRPTSKTSTGVMGNQ